MKGILLVLLVIAVVLFVSVESRRIRPKKPGKGGTHKPKKQGCFIRNCSRCDDGRRQCQECDDGFARITYNLKRGNKTIMSCEPCVKQEESKQTRKQVMERDDSKCPPVKVTEAPCRKNCASCTNGECIMCNKGFALVVSKRQKVKFCIPCVRRKAKMEVVDESKCPAACAKGCLNCTNGNCAECKVAFELNLETNQCEKKVNVTEAPCRKNCASCTNGECIKCNKGFALVVSKRQKVKFCIPCVRRKAKMVVVDESKCPAACAKGCLNCTNGNCAECKVAFELNLETNQCEKKDCGKGCVNCNESGTCTECNSKKGLTLVSRNGKSKCVKQREKKPKRKGGKKGSKIPQL